MINESYATKAPVATTKTERNHWRGMFSENVWNTAGTQTGDAEQVADCSTAREQTKNTRGHRVWLSVFWASPVRCRLIAAGSGQSLARYAGAQPWRHL